MIRNYWKISYSDLNDKNKNSYSLSCTIFCIDFQQYRDPIHENIQKYTFVQHDALLSA